MGWYNPDPYYQPEKFDLEKVGEIDMYEPNYDFDIIAVWRHIETNEVYWARDSGCSCPSPFEDYHSLDDLTKLVSANFDEFEREVKTCYRPDDARDLLRKVRKIMRG